MLKWISTLVGKIFPGGVEFSKNLTLLLSWSCASQVIMLFGAPFLTRLYTPSAIGYYSIYLAILYILNGTITLGNDLLIVKPKDASEGWIYVITSCINAVIVASVLVVILVLALTFDLGTIHHILLMYIWAIPLGVLTQGLRSNLSYWAIRQGFIKGLGKSKFFQAPVLIGAQILLGLFSYGVLGLVVSVLLSQILPLVYLYVLLKRGRMIFSFRIKINQYKKVVIEHRHFFSNTVLSNLLLGLSSYAPTLFFSFTYSPIITAYYVLAIQSIYSPFEFLGQAIKQMYMAEGVKVSREVQSALRMFHVKISARLFLLAMFPMLFVIFWGPALFTLVFGEIWREAGVYAQMLAGAILIKFVVTAGSQNLAILNKQHYSVIANAVLLVFILMAFLPSYVYHVSAIHTVMLLSICLGFAYAAIFLLNYMTIREGLAGEMV